MQEKGLGKGASCQSKADPSFLLTSLLPTSCRSNSARASAGAEGCSARTKCWATLGSALRTPGLAQSRRPSPARTRIPPGLFCPRVPRCHGRRQAPSHTGCAANFIKPSFSQRDASRTQGKRGGGGGGGEGGVKKREPRETPHEGQGLHSSAGPPLLPAPPDRGGPGAGKRPSSPSGPSSGPFSRRPLRDRT